MSDAAVTTNQIRAAMRTEVRALHEVSLARSLRHVAFTWSLIVGAMLLPVLVSIQLTGSGWVLSQLAAANGTAAALIAASMLLSMLVLASRQHALVILMHEGVHHTMARNRTINEFVANWLGAFPLGMVTSLYRTWHLAHHAAPNSADDPDFKQHLADEDYALPMLRRRLFVLMLKDVAGLNLVKWLASSTPWVGWPHVLGTSRDPALPARDRWQFALFWLLVAAASFATGTWLYLAVMWYVPVLTLVPAFCRLRSLAEHNNAPSADELDHTRHVDGLAIERFFIAPHHINFHIAHHYFPAVPHYNLPKLHRALLARPDVRQRAIVLSTYLGRRRSVAAVIGEPGGGGAMTAPRT